MACRADGQQQPKDLRIVLVGKTGAGKSATGNTILGREAFVSEASTSSVTEVCAKETAEVEQRKVAVIDTPGLSNTELDDKVLKEIKKCICLSSPGPHVFLVVIKIDRFTQEQETVEIIQETFGDSAKYTMVLFTHGDQLEGKGIKDFLDVNGKLNDFISLCGGGYHVFNNKDKDPSQVLELIKKIDNMATTNGGGYYTNEMFRKAEEAIEEKRKKNQENMARENDSLILEMMAGHPHEQGEEAGAGVGARGAARKGASGAARRGAIKGCKFGGMIVGKIGPKIAGAMGGGVGGLAGGGLIGRVVDAVVFRAVGAVVGAAVGAAVGVLVYIASK